MEQNEKTTFGSLVDAFGDVAGGIGTKIGGVASQLGVGLLNNAISQDNAREHREWLEKMWAKQNAYNDPSAMADRMRKAGLNPFTMMGAEPAGSVGQGAPASTIPINNPLDALRTIAEVRNLNASVGLTESQSEKVLAEVAVIQQQFQLGLLTYDEYRELLKQKFEDWAKANPITVERENTEADTALKESQTKTEDELRDSRKREIEQGISESESREAYNKSLTETADTMRPLLAQAEKANTAYTKARIANTIAQTSLIPFMQKEIESRTGLNDSQKSLNNINRDKVEEELIQLLDSRDFNLMIKEAGANEAKAKAAIEAAKAHVREVTLENVSGGTNLLDAITSTVDAFVWHLIND